MGYAIADQCVYVAHRVDRSAKMSTMVNKRISRTAKPQQIGQEKTADRMVDARGFSLRHPKSVDWGTGWRVLVRHHRERKKTKAYLREVSELAL